MKKLALFPVVVVITIAAVASAPVSAALPSALFSAPEITDVNVLMNRAKAGVTDLPGDAEMFQLTARDSAGIEILIPMLATTQKLAVLRHENGGLETQYVTTAFADIVFDKDGRPSPLWTDYQTISEVDVSISYRHTLTQYYSTTTSENKTYVKVDKYTAKWEQLDSQVIAKNAGILAGANGPRLGGGWTYDTEERTIGYPTSGTTYTLTVPSTWGYVEINEDVWHYQAGRMYCTLRRTPTGTEWEFDTVVVQGAFDDPWW